MGARFVGLADLSVLEGSLTTATVHGRCTHDGKKSEVLEKSPGGPKLLALLALLALFGRPGGASLVEHCNNCCNPDSVCIHLECTTLPQLEAEAEAHEGANLSLIAFECWLSLESRL